MRYRAEVDGLRALAVIPVILFHAGFALFSGGFVGVDVFFVISGYLITSILIKELDAGKFSIINFYERRARRILPALFLVVLVSIPFAWMWLTPPDMKDFAQSLIGVSTFSSNILFFFESGYFDTSAELKPLLHTWSLAVEEQYYIFFPLMLMATWRLGRRWTLVILGFAFILSFGLGQWGAYNKPSAAFYLLPARGWELLIGAFIAFYLQKRDHIQSQQFNQLASLLGLALVVYATFAFDQQTPFPTFYTLIPVIGTALIIFSAVKGTITNTLLSHKAMVGVGLISYSAYLWHQPIFAFARHRSLHEPSPTLFGILGIFSIFLAYFSWKYVEAPFRNKVKFDRSKIFLLSGIGLGILICLGIVGHVKNGVLHHYDNATKKILIPNYGVNTTLENCHREGSSYIPLESSCALGSKANVIGALIGDSHGYAISFSLDEKAKKHNVGLYQMTFNGCASAGNIYRSDFDTDNKCAEFNADVASYIKSNDKIEYVVMASRWTMFLEDEGFNNGEGGIEHTNARSDSITNGVRERNIEGVRVKKLKERLTETVTSYLNANKKVILIYPIPEVGWNVPKFTAHQLMFGGDRLGFSTSYALFKERNKIAFSTLDAIGEHQNLTRIYPDNFLCDNHLKERCVFALNNKNLYFDDNHVTTEGANLFINEILKTILR